MLLIRALYDSSVTQMRGLQRDVTVTQRRQQRIQNENLKTVQLYTTNIRPALGICKTVSS